MAGSMMVTIKSSVSCNHHFLKANMLLGISLQMQAMMYGSLISEEIDMDADLVLMTSLSSQEIKNSGILLSKTWA